MKQTIMDRVYESMACDVIEAYRMPGVEDAFAPGSLCMGLYEDMQDAYERLRQRLGVEDEDADVEIIIHSFLQIQKELCCRMYRYGACFGLTEE